MDALLPVVLSVCCGIDVHKKSLTACLLTTGASGGVLKESRVFRTMTGQLQELAAWLVQAGCRHVAIESTGVYWKPVFNVLEQAGLEVVLVNAPHVKNVPGRKTDVKDAEWLATLLRVGLLRSSFVPPQEIRELRDLTLYRTQVVRQRADECNRIQKLLENCNIKLASVASNVLGASGRDVLRALGEGLDNPGALANMARGKLRDKLPQLEEALRGVMSATQRWLLREQLHKVGELDEAILRLDAKVAELCLPFARALALLDQIPGVNQRVAQVIVAEVGLDMGRLKSAAQLASWAGMCPGNHESAGKPKGGKVRKGNRWLRQALVEAAWASSHAKDTSLSATYHRIKGRRRGKRACLAAGHRILRMAYTLLARRRPYAEEGPDYYRGAGQGPSQGQASTPAPEEMGYAVTVTVAEPAA
jgi:transposase